MSDKAHSQKDWKLPPTAPRFEASRPAWQTLFAPLASFWAILLTVLLVFAINGPGWLHQLAASDQNRAGQAEQELMRDVRRITAPARGAAVPVVDSARNH